MAGEEYATADDEYDIILRQFEITASEKREKKAAALMRLIAVQLQTNKPLPRPVRNWLSHLLIHGSKNTHSEDRLVFILAKRRRPDYDLQVEEFAYVHALTTWGWTQDAAARGVAEFFAGEEIDPTPLKKRINSARGRWTAEGPWRQMRPEGEPPEATVKHLQDGDEVIVELHTTGERRASTRTFWIKKAVLEIVEKYAAQKT